MSVDIELGYADTIDGIVENVTKIIEAGAVGINIEDGCSKPTPYLENLDIQIKKSRLYLSLKKSWEFLLFLMPELACFY